jgi:predicted RNase H-like HicB family nuclease
MNMIEDLAVGVTGIANWSTFEHERRLRCRVLIVPEAEGGYSVFAADLPGAASQAETIDDAKRNIEDALTEVIRCYRDAGEEIPWGDAGVQKTNDSIEIYVTVNG